VTTPSTIHAEPDEIELHARAVDRLADWLGELVPGNGDVRLRGPHEPLPAWSEQPGADLPGWRELCATLAEHETAVVRAQRLLLDRLQSMATGLHQQADQLREVDEATRGRWERLP
jgi:hypothetical protein